MYDTRLRDLTCVKDVGEKIQTFFKVESDVTEHGIHAGLVVLALWSSTNCPMDWYRSPLTSWTNKRRGVAGVDPQAASRSVSDMLASWPSQDASSQR